MHALMSGSTDQIFRRNGRALHSGSKPQSQKPAVKVEGRGAFFGPSFGSLAFDGSAAGAYDASSMVKKCGTEKDTK